MGGSRASPKGREKGCCYRLGTCWIVSCAQLNQAGHTVTVYERDDRVGGLLMYGIPNMKLNKNDIVERRLNLLREEGIIFVPNTPVGDGSNGKKSIDELKNDNDAVLLCTGATQPRDLSIPGRELKGVHFAMDFFEPTRVACWIPIWTTATTSAQRVRKSSSSVVVIREQTASAPHCDTGAKPHNFELFPRPPEARAADNPWPTWPVIFRTDYAHEESAARFGDDPRVYAISTVEFVGNDKGELTGLKTVHVALNEGRIEPVEGTEKTWEADLVFLSMGYLDQSTTFRSAGYRIRSAFQLQSGIRYVTNVDKVFAAGDCRRGQSLVVRAINEGREAAREVDRYLMGKMLP